MRGNNVDVAGSWFFWIGFSTIHSRPSTCRWMECWLYRGNHHIILPMKKLYLVDVSSMFFRAFYAIRELSTSKGQPTNALYGFLNMTLKLLKDSNPEYMVYCRDRKEPSFRKDLDPRYKANRSEMPEDLQKQMPYITELTSAMGIPQMDMEKFEADDVIGSLSRWGIENGFEVVIVSGDKDFAQLVSPVIKMFDPMKNVIFDEPYVEGKWGVKAEQFIDYLAIVGDSSDNIPGIKGIGPKGAVKLLSEYKSLEGVYDNTELLTGNTKKKVEEGKDEAFLSKELVTIRQDLKLAESADDVALKPIDQEKLHTLLAELEFESFIKKIAEVSGDIVEEQKPTDDPVVFELKSKKDLDKYFKAGEEVFVINSERGIFLENKEGKLCGLPYDEEILFKLGKEIKAMELKFLGFGLKSLQRSLGLQDMNIVDDTQLMCYSIKSENWDFKRAYETFCDSVISEFGGISELIESHRRLHKAVDEKLQGKARQLYQEIEKPLLSVLARMEHEGILLDTEILAQQSEELAKTIKDITTEVHAMVEETFNLASPKQLSEILFGKLGLKPIKKTKTGFSTNTDVLEKLKHEHPVCEKIIEFRESSKLKSTYVDALPKLLNSKTKRIHSTFNQAVTTTGRLSSVSPNLQNIPIKTELGRRVRRGFIPKEGFSLVSADYSQIELRILAHISEDPGLIHAFKNHQDIHKRTAAEVFGLELEEVSSDQRRIAKAVNFGIAYGQGVYGLAEALGIPRGEASGIIKDYFTKFAGVQTYMTETIEKARDKGYVETLFGRKRELYELKASNKAVQKFGERAAINAPIQGTASDLIKMAMVTVAKEVKSPLLIQVHDELVFEVKDSEIESESKLIKDIMETIYPLSIPIIVNVGSGKDWEQAH